MKVLLMFFVVVFSWAEILHVNVPAPQFVISDGKISAENCTYINQTGAPNVPCKVVTICLPPGAIIENVHFYGTRQESGICDILPAQAPLPLINDATVKGIQKLFNKQKDKYYSTDRIYPQEHGFLLSKGGLRKYTLATVICHHFAYNAVTNKFYYAPNIDIEIQYKMPAPSSERAEHWQRLMDDVSFDEIASQTIYNWQDARVWYHTDNPRQANGYYIIIPAALVSSVNTLVAYRQTQGYNVNTVTVEYIQSNIPGDDLEQKIRNYLRTNMADIKFALLVGTITQVPMRYLVPFNNDPDGPFDDTLLSPMPTDLYYAELTDPDTLSWNSDRDLYYGEVYDENIQPLGDDNPDYHADIHLGRIPHSAQNDIEAICNKFVTFDNNTDVSYKTGSLLAGAIVFFENENYTGYPRIDGSDEMEKVMNDAIINRSNAVYLYEKAGLRPSPYPCTDSLTKSNMISYWNNKGIVYEYNHGWYNQYARKIWVFDDGDSIAENNELQMIQTLYLSDVFQLDNNFPATTFLRSCLCGKPEVTGLGASLLRYGSSSVICGSRSVWVSLVDPGGVAYHFFNRLLKDTIISNGVIGNAFDLARIDFMDSCGLWTNTYVFQLYGDPALRQFGRLIGIDEYKDTPLVSSFSIYPNPTTGLMTIQFNSTNNQSMELDVYDECGRLVQRLNNGVIKKGSETVNMKLPAGVYFLKLRIEEREAFKKIVIIN